MDASCQAEAGAARAGRSSRRFHSGGLHRQKSRIAAQASRFVAALADILERSKPPSEAFEILRQHFLGIKGAGVNLLTEIQHAIVLAYQLGEMKRDASENGFAAQRANRSGREPLRD